VRPDAGLISYYKEAKTGHMDHACSLSLRERVRVRGGRY